MYLFILYLAGYGGISRDMAGFRGIWRDITEFISPKSREIRPARADLICSAAEAGAPK
jgi:hypothetical protein